MHNKNNYILITGATGGLGHAFAAECAARGWNLFLTDVSQPALNSVTAGLKRLYNVEVRAAACDLTDDKARQELWRLIDDSRLRFHGLINVAGLDYEGPFDKRQVRELHTMVRLNIEATIEMTRRALPYKAPDRVMHIINVSSLAAFYPMPVKAVYAASKRFLLDWSLALDHELRQEGITVTALCPAGMPTTPACIRSIDAQGVMGRLTTLNVGDVAAQTIDRALKGQQIVVPGLINQVLRVAGSLVPAPLVAFFINKRWQKSHLKSHGEVGILAADIG